MWAQIFFVTSLRGSGSVPTILARCSEGCIGFIKALFFALGVVFAIFRSPYLCPNVPNSTITGIVTDQVGRRGKSNGFDTLTRPVGPEAQWCKRQSADGHFIKHNANQDRSVFRLPKTALKEPILGANWVLG